MILIKLNKSIIVNAEKIISIGKVMHYGIESIEILFEDGSKFPITKEDFKELEEVLYNNPQIHWIDLSA